MTGVAYAAPLLEEQVLHQLVLPDLPGAANGPAGNCRRIALRDVGFPARPGRLVLRLLHGHEEREVIEPARMIAAEAIEAIALLRPGGLLEPIQHLRPERAPMLNHGGEVDPSFGPGGTARCLVREQPVLGQPFEADEQRIAGKRREALIRRIAVPGGAERQNLPDALPCRREPVDERESARSEIADVGASRQRRRMEEDAGG